jgi:hypothetical protein
MQYVSFLLSFLSFLVGETAGAVRVSSEQKLSKTQGNLDAALVGSALDFTYRGAAFIGDIDGDGHIDAALGQDLYGGSAGAVLIAFLDASGAALSTLRLSSADANINVAGLGASDKWGSTVSDLGDLNGDGIPDMAVGAVGNSGAGGVYICFLAIDGTVTTSTRISNSAGGLVGTIPAGADFGTTVGNLGDLDSDGVIDIIVGAPYDGEGTRRCHRTLGLRRPRPKAYAGSRVWGRDDSGAGSIGFAISTRLGLGVVAADSRPLACATTAQAPCGFSFSTPTERSRTSSISPRVTRAYRA